MRDLKRRYFLEPPLTGADLVGLGLKPRDTTHTAGGTPTARVTIETFPAGRHEPGIKIIYIIDVRQTAGYRQGASVFRARGASVVNALTRI
jgi:hypothetical protein